MGADWFGWRVSWLLFSHTVDRGALVAQRDRPFMAQEPQTKLPPNESNIPTLNPLRVDRAPALRGAGLFALVPEARE